MADVPVLVCTAGDLNGRTIRVPEGGLDISDEAEAGYAAAAELRAM